VTILIVEYQLDPETKGWTATMPKVPSLVTQGKTLKEVHGRVRVALSLVRDDAADVILQGRTLWPQEYGISREALQAVQEEADLRVKALDVEALLERATAHAVRVLVVQERQTFRSAGSLLGISHQRVEQITQLNAVE